MSIISDERAPNGVRLITEDDAIAKTREADERIREEQQRTFQAIYHKICAMNTESVSKKED